MKNETANETRRNFLTKTLPVIAAGSMLPLAAQAKAVVEKPLPPNPADMSKAELWLRSVPKIEDGDLTLTVELTMNRRWWFNLAQGAAHNDWTLEQAIVYMVVDNHDGVCEWSNREYTDDDRYDMTSDS